MAEYRAKQGREDRNGEMTGAISFNMIMVMLPVNIWCFGMLPWLGLWPTLVTGLVLAVGLTLLCRPISQRIWARFSDWADKP